MLSLPTVLKKVFPSESRFLLINVVTSSSDKSFISSLDDWHESLSAIAWSSKRSKSAFGPKMINRFKLALVILYIKTRHVVSTSSTYFRGKEDLENDNVRLRFTK